MVALCQKVEGRHRNIVTSSIGFSPYNSLKSHYYNIRYNIRIDKRLWLRLYFDVKIKAVFIILLFLFVSILSPFSIHTNLADSDKPVIFTLNVCHAADAPLSGNTDLPSLYELQINFSPPLLSGNLEIHHQTLIDLPVTSPEDKPPRA